MTEDAKTIADALAYLRAQTENKTEQAELLTQLMANDPRLLSAVARDLVARQVPHKGTVPRVVREPF